MPKTIKRLLFGLVGLLIVVLLGLYVARFAILESALQGHLDEQGISPAHYTIAEFDTGRLILTDIGLGGEVTAKLLHLTYSLTGVVQGEVEQVFIDGLRVKLDITGEGPPLGSLQDLVETDSGPSDDGAAASGKSAALPAIAIQDTALLVETAAGLVEVQVEGEVWSDDAGAPQGAVSYQLTSEMGSVKGLVALSGQADGRIIGNVILDEGSLTLDQAKASNLAGGGNFVMPDGTIESLGMDLNLALDDLVLMTEGVPAPPFESAQIAAAIDGSDARMTVDLTEADQGLVLQLFASAEDFRGEPQTALSGILDLPPNSRLWDAFDIAPPDGGGLRLDINASGPLPDPESLLEKALEDPWVLTDAAIDFDLALSSEGLNMPDLGEGLSGLFSLSGRLADGGLSLRIDDTTNMTLARPAGALLEGLGLAASDAESLSGLGIALESGSPLEAEVARQADGLAVKLSGALALNSEQAGSARLEGNARFGLDRDRRLAAVEQAGFEATLTDIAWQGHQVDQATLAATLSGPPGNLSGRVTSRASAPALLFGGLTARNLEAVLKGDLAVKSGQFTLAVQPSSNVQAREVILADGVALEEALELTVGPGDLTISRAEDGAIALRHKIGMTLQGNSVAVERAEEQPLTIAFTPAPLSLDGSMTGDLGYALAARLLQTNLDTPDLNLTVKGLGVDANYNTSIEGLGLNFKADSIADSGAEPRFEPLTLKGQLTETGADSYHISAQAGWPEAPDSLLLEGDLQPGEARGAGEMQLGPFEFAPGGLQPKDLSPLAALLEAVEGSGESRASFSWSSEGLISAGSLNLENLSFTAQGTNVKGLDLALVLTDLTAPESASDQRLTIAALDPGLPVTDLEVMFRVLPGDLPVMQIDDGTFKVLGGEFGLEPTTLNPGLDRHDLTFDIRNLALDSLFESLELDGVSGEGALNGRIPIRLEGSTFAIADGQLSAIGPGRLQIQSEEAEELIGQRDDNVDSMLEALRDFRYEEFTITMDKNSDQDLVVALSVLGNNPDVLDGQMFQINVNLESNIDNILNALSAGLAASDQRIRDLWRRLKE